MRLTFILVVSFSLGVVPIESTRSAAAMHTYRNFIVHWQNADPKLQPRVAAARAALARLERR